MLFDHYNTTTMFCPWTSWQVPGAGAARLRPPDKASLEYLLCQIFSCTKSHEQEDFSLDSFWKRLIIPKVGSLLRAIYYAVVAEFSSDMGEEFSLLLGHIE